MMGLSSPSVRVANTPSSISGVPTLARLTLSVHDWKLSSIREFPQDRSRGYLTVASLLCSMSDAPDSDDREWQFGVEEVGEDAEPTREPIEPGSPSVENVAFVLLGVLLAIAILLVSIGVVP